MAVKERPAGITVLVILQVVGSVLLLIFGLGLLFLSAFIAGFLASRVGIFLLDVLGVVSGFFTLVAGGMVIMALIGFFIAWCLWAGKGWAWVIALTLAILGVIGGLLTLPIGIITIVIEGLIIYYLTPSTRQSLLRQGSTCTSNPSGCRADIAGARTTAPSFPCFSSMDRSIVDGQVLTYS